MMENDFYPAYFKTGDLDFIEKNYPELYSFLKPDITPNRLNVTIHSEQQWDKIWDLFSTALAESLNDSGNDLSENGFRIESIIDNL